MYPCLAEGPSFIETPPALAKVAEDQKLILTCSASGTPRPSMTWKRGSPEQVVDNATDAKRIVITAQGELVINVSKLTLRLSMRYTKWFDQGLQLKQA